MGGGSPTQEKSITATTSQQIIVPDTNYVLSKVTVNPQVHSTTFQATTRNSSINMGTQHNYRYVNTNDVPNSNSGTYPATSRGSQVDMGATNTYRYVNTTGVPNSNSGTYEATSRSSSIDMGSTNSYRYVNTQNVPYNDRTTLWKGNNQSFLEQFVSLNESFRNFKWICFSVKKSTSDSIELETLLDSEKFHNSATGQAIGCGEYARWVIRSTETTILIRDAVFVYSSSGGSIDNSKAIPISIIGVHRLSGTSNGGGDEPIIIIGE